MKPSSRTAHAAAGRRAPSSAATLTEAALRQTLSDRIRVCRQLGVRVPAHLRRGNSSDLLLRVSLLDHRLTRALELRGGVCLREARPPDPPEPELPPTPWEPPEEDWEDEPLPEDDGPVDEGPSDQGAADEGPEGEGPRDSEGEEGGASCRR